MINTTDILETINMIQEENLDIRTITMGISLLDCADSDVNSACQKIYDKIMKKAGNLVKTGQDIEKEFGVPIINKRISVTPISLVLLTKEAKKEFGEYYMVALAPLLIRVGINIFDKSTDRIINTINNSIEETKEDVQISEFVDERKRKFIVDNNYYLSPSMFRDFIAPILKNKVKNNIISGDADSIIKAIEEILILL